MGESSHRRLIILVFAQLLVVALIVAQLARLQIVEHTRLTEAAAQDHVRHRILVAPRGRIWDRNYSALVGNSTRYQVTTDPSSLVDVDQAVNALSPILGLAPGDLRARLAEKQTNVLLATALPMNVGRAVSKLDLWAVYATPYWQRAYPEGSLAAHVLGFVNAEGAGYYGIEGYYDATLRGQESDTPIVVDVWLGLSPFDFHRTTSPQPGLDLVLTLDRTFQALTEAELARALAETGAQSGSIIVLDPRTGEILALANSPTFDPNAYPTTPAEQFTNPAVSIAYEPGSVFKILTMGAALQEGMVQPDTVYNDTACTEIGGRTICNWDRRGHGTSTMVDLLAHSSNVGAATLSTRLGAQAFYRAIQAFGISVPTGVDLQAEAQGNLRVPGDVDWHESDLATNAFGQGLTATPIQIVTAVAAVANDGIMMRPHIVAHMLSQTGEEDLQAGWRQITGEALTGALVGDLPGENGDRSIVAPAAMALEAHEMQIQSARPTELGRPLSPEVAHTLTEMLAQAVEREVPQACVPGYRIAGKTGTAQIPIPGGYDDPWTIASFVGYGPVHDPRLVILVKLDRPTSSPYGSATAAPVFQRLAARLFILMKISPDNT